MVSSDPTPLNPSGNVLPIMIHVTAPATLPAGYTFEAAINGDESKLVNIEVPEGGVEEGQVFLAPLPPNYVGARIAAPTGRWKDGLFNCFAEGPCHPSFWCALCCTQLSMAQVISRMQLTWLGQFGSLYSSQHAFLAIAIIVLSFFIYSTALELAALQYDTADPYDVPEYLAILRFTGNLIFTAWSVYALCRTRQNVRARYQIPEQYCKGCEDVCCALWCSCCTSAQLLRHTGEYESYPGVCCSRTGHPPGTPIVV